MLISLDSRPAQIATGFCLFLLTNNASALCLNARHPSVSDELKLSNMVVVANVTSSLDESSPDDPEGVAQTTYSLKIVKVFKGLAAKEVKVTSENTSGGFPMDVGKSYLLFITSYSGGLNIVDSCGSSGLATNRTSEIEILRKTMSAQAAD